MVALGSCALTGCRVRPARWWRSARGCPGRREWPMRPARPGSGWRGRWRRRGSAAWSRRRGRSSGRRRTASRPIAAERLVRLLMIGGLHAVRVPSGEEEALRDLVRAREDVRGDLMRARHRMGKLLLRHDVRYDGAGDNWTARHREWLGRVELGDRGAQVTLLDYVGALDATIAQLVPDSPWATTVARLRCLRGIDTLTAVGLCAEIGDFERFARAGQLASYLGVVPSEHSSGDKRRLGSITKTGSQHARRLLIEAAWHYRRPPRRGTALAARQV